jgi:bacterioferritin
VKTLRILTRAADATQAQREFLSRSQRAKLGRTLLEPLDRPRRPTRRHHVPSINKQEVVDQLNRILECELAGVVRYTHYSMMIFGYSRIPIVSWFQDEATESLAHAQKAGELVTRLGGHPSLAIGPLLETHQHDIGEILRETLQAEHTALGHYNNLLAMVAGKNVALEEYARDLIEQEEAHIDEIDKMLRKPGDTDRSKEARDLK